MLRITALVSALVVCGSCAVTREPMTRQQDGGEPAPGLSKPATVVVTTNSGTRSYHIDNSGDVDVSASLQAVFDEIAAIPDVSATFSFAPGVYYLDAPVRVQACSLRMVGHGHGGTDIHGANMQSGTTFRLGRNCGPNCMTFEYAGRSRAFPSGEAPWPNRNLKVDLENLTFVGCNNTGVDTAGGYSRFRGDEPDFRGLHWYPSEDRYEDPERDGQRAIVLPPPPAGEGVAKCELLRVTSCYFTDLYVGIDVAACDVSYLDKNWFGQLTHAVRYHGAGQVTFVSNNCFADLETALTLAHPIMSAFSNNTFAYVSKCFEIDRIESSSITGNVLYNWKISTGAAAFGGFCHIENASRLTVTGNTISQFLDSRKRTRTVDPEPNGQSFIQFDNARQLIFADNVVHTALTQTVIRLHDCRECAVTDNIITFASGGNAVAQTGECRDNFYRPIDPALSSPFDDYEF